MHLITDEQREYCLMKTEVVLKSLLISKTRQLGFCLMKTEVVLKSVYDV